MKKEELLTRAANGDVIIDRDLDVVYPIKKEKTDETDEKSFTIFKTDDDQHLVFGWASVSITVDGQILEDRQHDTIDPEDLEEAAYEYVLNFRDTGEEHMPGYRKKGKLVESCVFTAEKQKAMGIPEGILPVAWWIGFKIDDEDTWRLVKNGTYKMFSIEGRAQREEIQKAESTARSFEEVLKFNPYHDSNGRFSTAEGNKMSSGGSSSIRTSATQQYTSSETSINSSKVPAVFSKVDWKEGTTNIDIGGGKFDTATEYLAKKKVKNLVYDPYNRTKEHNDNVIEQINKKKADTATISNVLNVIQEKEARTEVLRNAQRALKEDGKCYITVYEGNKSGEGKPSTKGYQLNRKLKDYLPEVLEVFPSAEIKRGMIIASNGKVKKSFARDGENIEEIEEITKFNPYHGYHGYFSTAEGATSVTARTKYGPGQKAIANIKAKATGEGLNKYPMGNTKQKNHKSADGIDTYLNDDDYPPKPDATTYRKVAKDLQISEEQAKAMAESIYSYASYDYKEIRASSRGENDSFKTEAENCEEFIKASPKWAGGKIYRGIKINNDADLHAIMDKASKGQPIDMRGISSWSTEQAIAEEFASDFSESGLIHPIVFVTNGTSTKNGTSVKHLSKYTDENEVLVSKDAVFTPTKIEAAGGTIYIYGDMP